MDDEAGSTMIFALCVGAIQVLAILSVALVTIWMGKYRGGFAWDGSQLQFNYHPLCMVVAFVFIFSEAIIIYRVFKRADKFSVKIVHFLLQLVAFCVAVVGLTATFGFHNAKGYPNMYSLHSWIGMATMVLFSLQLACGFYSFLFPKLPDQPRGAYLRIHVLFGVLIFVLVIATCLTGMTENLLFHIKATYPKFVTEGVLVNILGLVLVTLAAVVCYVMTNSTYKRTLQSSEEDMELLRGKDEE